MKRNDTAKLHLTRMSLLRRNKLWRWKTRWLKQFTHHLPTASYVKQYSLEVGCSGRVNLSSRVRSMKR